MNSLGIIIPVYNEEKNISNLLRQWLKIVPKHFKKKYKFFIINDGSNDKTHNYINKIKNKSIFYIRQKNIGHGNTCIKGYKLAIRKKYEIIFQIDSDNQCDPKYFKSFLNLIKKNEAVFGYRSIREDGFLRKIFSTLLSILIFIKTSIYVRDSNVPYRMIRRKALMRVINDIPKSVMLKNAYLSYLIQKNFKIKWIDITFRKRAFGKTNYNFKNLIFMTLNLLFKLK